MSRRLIPLTDEIKDSSLHNVKTWDGIQEEKKATASQQQKEDENECSMLVRDIVSKLNQKSSGSFNVFMTRKSSESPFITKVNVEEESIKDEVGRINENAMDLKCKKLTAKNRQSIETQKKIALEAEKVALEKCRNGNKMQTVQSSNKIDYSNDKNISLETLKGNETSKIRTSPSLLLPSIPTRKMLNVMKPRTSVKIKDEIKKSKKCEKFNFNPREMQKELEGKPLKIIKRGENFFVKTSNNENEIEFNENKQEMIKSVPTCRPRICINNPKFEILTSKLKNIPKPNDVSLGKPYGIQLGLRNFHNEKTAELDGLHIGDIILVAHGVSCVKHPANWSDRDIDQILQVGAELYKNTKDVSIDKFNSFTKGFTFHDKFIQVTCSEPKIVGKIIALGERSMDLYNGLYKFFASYTHALFVTNKLDLYIMTENGGFYVFDPRGRNEKCERNNGNASALMAFISLDNLYHLIVNLSNVHSQSSFKISSLKITRYSYKANELHEFTVQTGNPNKKTRSNDFEVINDHVACLQGTISLNSNIFSCLRNRHGLTSSIMAILYSKIDPAITWTKPIFDRVMHFGYKMHMDCLDGGVIRNLALPEIPSKFYIGDSYLTTICIVPYIHRRSVQKTRVTLDNPIAEILLEAFKSFRCLLLEIDNFYFSAWRSEDNQYFFFFDGYQKTLDGYSDTYIGSSFLFMANIVDFICDIIINRITKISENSLKIHGLKVLELKKLSKEEMKNKKVFKLIDLKCITPYSSDDVENIQDVPSTVDSVMPLLTKSQLKILDTKTPEKPQHLNITDLNSPSLVCCKQQAYYEIMTSIEKKLSAIKKPEVRCQTMELMHEIHSEMLNKIMGHDVSVDVKNCNKSISQENVKGWKKNEKNNRWTPFGEYVGTAEKVLLKTDLDCLNEEREKICNTQIDDNDDDLNFEEIVEEVSEEISHFQKLPDGSRIVSGTKSMFKLPLDKKIFNFENFSVIIAVAAIVTSTKYNISSWSSEIVDYVLACGEIMSGAINLKKKMDFYTHDEHIFPKIHINEKFYNLKLSAILNAPFNAIENFMKDIFNGFDRFILVTAHGSLAIFKSNEKFYFFEYATCNRVGYRIKNDDYGSSCLLSFNDIHSLVRRINSNHEIQEHEKFLIYRVSVTGEKEKEDESLSDEQLTYNYVPFTISKENLIIENFRQNREMRKTELLEKLQANNEAIKEEKDRIKNYRQQTGQEIPTHLTEDSLQHWDLDKDKFKDEDLEFDINAPTLDNQLPMLHSSWASFDIIGYNKDVDEDLYRIKGSFGYENRMEMSDSKLKKCHFACLYSIMYAVHYTFDSMNFRSVDVILENGMKIFERVNKEDYEEQMILQGVLVDDIIYELIAQEFSSKNKIKTPEDLVNKFFIQQKYGMLQGRNCCMAIIKEKNLSKFHIFDPYDITDDGSKNEIQNSIASWITFSDINMVLDYFMARIVKTDDDKIPFKMYHIGILSYNPVKKSQKAGYFLFNTSSNSLSDIKSCAYVDETADEKIEWVTKTLTIPWSRLEKCNTDGNERYTKITKWKEFDVEMKNKLYSLWGNIHPAMKYFKPYSGKQNLTCCTVAIIMSHLIKIDDWSSDLLDSIVTYGNQFLLKILENSPNLSELTFDDIKGKCQLEGFEYNVSLQLEILGKLYNEDKHQINLNRAFDYVFRDKKLSGVILYCGGRSLAIGNYQNRSFFMYDCQSLGGPLFKPSQGTTYVLKCCCMKVLLACIILTLNLKQHGVKFYLYSVQAVEGDNELEMIKSKSTIANQPEKEDEDISES